MRLSTKACEMMLQDRPLKDFFIAPMFYFVNKDGVVLGSGALNNRGVFVVPFDKIGLIDKFIVSSGSPGIQITGTVGERMSKDVDLAVPSRAVGIGDEFTVCCGPGELIDAYSSSLWTRIKDKVKGWTL